MLVVSINTCVDYVITSPNSATPPTTSPDPTIVFPKTAIGSLKIQIIHVQLLNKSKPFQILPIAANSNPHLPKIIPYLSNYNPHLLNTVICQN